MYSKCVQTRILETVDKTIIIITTYKEIYSRHLLCNILPLSPAVSWLVPLAATLGRLGGQWGQGCGW